MLIRTISPTKLMMPILKRSCALVNSSWCILSLKREIQSIQLRSAKTLNETLVNERLGQFFKNSKCAAKMNQNFGFVLKNIEDGGFIHFYAHKNTTLQDRSKLLCNKDDLAKLRDVLNKTNVIESCIREK